VCIRCFTHLPLSLFDNGVHSIDWCLGGEYEARDAAAAPEGCVLKARILLILYVNQRLDLNDHVENTSVERGLPSAKAFEAEC
jgi:hypothetical protein